MPRGLHRPPPREACAFAIHLTVLSAFIWAMIRLGLRSWNDFTYLLREDGAFETLTAGFLFLSCAVAHHLALSKVNVQGELNLHNIEGLHGRTEIRISLVLSAFGSFSGILIALALRRARPGTKTFAFCDAARWFTIPLRFSPYFLQMFVYVMLRRHDSPLLQVFPEKRLIKELAECLFALGCYLALFCRLRVDIPRLRSACVAEERSDRGSPAAPWASTRDSASRPGEETKVGCQAPASPDA